MSESNHPSDVVTPSIRFHQGEIPPTVPTSPSAPQAAEGGALRNRFHEMIPASVRGSSEGISPSSTAGANIEGLTPPPTVGSDHLRLPLKAGQGATSRQDFSQPPAPHVSIRVDPQELIACLYEVKMPATARRLFCTLFEVGLETVRERGLPTRPDVAVFHLPSELLAAHFGVDRVTIWRNLKPLIEAGILASRDHYATLRGATAVSGKVWAVSLNPARVLAGKAAPVRVTKDDLAFRWRDLDADARKGRTAYSATRTEAQQAAEKAKREASAEQHAVKLARAEARAKDREAAHKMGQRPLRGRAAATANAARTRAEKLPPVRAERRVQQSLGPLKPVSKEELKRWALAPFKENFDVTLTVAKDLGSAQDAIYTLPILTGLSRRERSAAVEGLARKLAISFDDQQNLRFWTWLIWQMLRAYDQGQDWSGDIKLILLRVVRDVEHDKSMRKPSRPGVQEAPAVRPGALVVNELRNCKLLEALKRISPSRVGVKPKVMAA